jgi:integrase
MGRRVKSKELDAREARLKLKVRPKPYYQAIARGLHLGYRKLKEQDGTWLARYYLGNQTYEVERIGAADDLSDADGVAIIDYWQACDKARDRMVERAHARAGKTGPLTVADVMDTYLEFLESEGRSNDAVADVHYRDMAFIRPRLGHLEANSLTDEVLRKWRDALAKVPPRSRTKSGTPQKYRDGADQRARRASANRNWTALRAALNHAFNAGKITSDAAWKRVKPFKSVHEARVRYLSIAEAKRLINACEADFRPLLEAALLTGGRYGQLAKLTVDNFNADAGTVTMRTRKGNGSVKTYHVHLTAEGVTFFNMACARRNGAKDLIFQKADGTPWKKSNQAEPIKVASERAKIDPPANFHVTRHTWASHAVMNGVPLMVVAGNLGHRDTRMVELHYGHLAPRYRKDEIRKGAPTFGIEPDGNVASLDKRRTRDSGH